MENLNRIITIPPKVHLNYSLKILQNILNFDCKCIITKYFHIFS